DDVMRELVIDDRRNELREPARLVASIEASLVAAEGDRPRERVVVVRVSVEEDLDPRRTQIERRPRVVGSHASDAGSSKRSLDLSLGLGEMESGKEMRRAFDRALGIEGPF